MKTRQPEIRIGCGALFLGGIVALAACDNQVVVSSQDIPSEQDVTHVTAKLEGCTPEYMSFEWLGAGCEATMQVAQVTYWVSVNNTQVFGFQGADHNCYYCDQNPTSNATIPPWFFDYAWNPNGVNTISVWPDTGSEKLSWMKVSVGLSSGGTPTTCMFDHAGSNCTTTNFCQGFCFDYYGIPCNAPFETTVNCGGS